jgi:hypothetical protein
MFVVVFLILISVMAAISEKNHYETERPAIVFAEMASVKSEPKLRAPMFLYCTKARRCLWRKYLTTGKNPTHRRHRRLD